MVAPPPPYDAPCPQWVVSAMLVAETRHPAVRTARLGGLWSTKPRATERSRRVANPIKTPRARMAPRKKPGGRSWLDLDTLGILWEWSDQWLGSVKL